MNNFSAETVVPINSGLPGLFAEKMTLDKLIIIDKKFLKYLYLHRIDSCHYNNLGPDGNLFVLLVY